MVREIHARLAAGGEQPERLDDARRDALHEAASSISDRLPGDHRVEVASFDAATGNAAVVVSSAAAPQQGSYVARALRHVQDIGSALGFSAVQAPEYVADPSDQATSTGAVAVHLRQQYKGITIYDAAQTVRFRADGSLKEVAGRAVTVADDLSVSPTVTAEGALRTAAAHVAEGDDPDDAPIDQFGEAMVDPGLDLAGFEPLARTSGADRPDHLATFDAPPFAHTVSVSLMWLPVDASLRLCWHTKLNVPGGAVYRVLVDATSGEVLLATRLTQAIAGRADVVLVAGGAPAPVTMPREAASYGAPVPEGLPAGFPEDWLTEASTRGTSVEAVIAPSTLVSGTLSSGQVVFAPAAGSSERLVINLFALCSSMHDLLYLLGFREADGNFQADNHGRGGRAPDSVFALVHPGAVWGTANMGTPADGSRPTMNMGLVTSTNRHTALDADVVIHEYAHGLTNRLVGGALDDTSLEAVQSRGMGEGWSDFFACIALGKNVVGDWVVNRASGIRKFRYNDTFPDTYADLGTGRYAGDSVHNLGEVWCATLLAAARQVGAWPFAQIVVDALKLTAARPSFLAARDAIILATRQFATARGDERPEVLVGTVWRVFAGFGMGPGARTDGPDVLTGIVADFEAPPAPDGATVVRAEANPALAIPDNDRVGVLSTVTVPAAGFISAAAVTVAVAHPYVGDLVVALLAPWGARVSLHSRTGGSADDLRQMWDDAGHAEVAALVGHPCGGEWSLSVSDHAARDTGTLEGWSLELGVTEARPLLEGEVVAGVAIPDNDDEGITSELVLDSAGTISSLTLGLDITHTYVGDLQVTLTGPDGTTAHVHDRVGGSADNLIATFASDGGGTLAELVGKPAGGAWKLTCIDRAGRDVGKLNRWRLAVAI